MGMMNDTAKRTAFIQAAVATAARHGFDGYNLVRKNDHLDAK